MNRNSSELSKNVLHEVNRVIIGVIYPFLLAISKSIIVIFILAFIIYANPFLSISIAIILSSSYGVIYLVVRKNLRVIGNKTTKTVFYKYKFVDEALTGIKDVKLRGSEKQFLSKYDLPAEKFAGYNAKTAVIALLPRYALETIAFGGILLIVIYLIATQNDYTKVIPLVSMYALAGYRLMPGLQQVYHSFVQIRFNTPALEVLIKDIEDENNSSKQQNEIENKFNIPSLRKNVTFKSVTYSYPESKINVLNNINLSIKNKSMTAFVGYTGSGKTTLIDIFLGLLQPTIGNILIDDIEVNEKNIKSWQSKLGYVPQNIYLTDDTIKNNIAFAIQDDQIDINKVIQAAKLAEIDTFIETLPLKYETEVGERGIRLSGGQIQRIGIARALYNNPEILVFDEATSSLDNITENNIINSIKKLSAEKTILIVAHRLSTIKYCDDIYVLDNGKLVGQGKFDELKKKSKIFENMTKSMSADIN